VTDILSISDTEPLFLAGHLALDFINTAFGVGSGAKDCLRTDVDVASWLKRASLPFSAPDAKRGALLSSALELREVALALVKRRKAGVRGNAARLNQFLKLGNRHDELHWPRSGRPVLQTHERLRGANGVLLPIARAVAELLSEADFDRVRRCGGADCTLWFLDLTKAHSRRWCSPAVCGNRAKVAAFRGRARLRGSSPL
jgi:predicted RNA-binding Zn ribbon-like protein